jgi:hypothetical protein
MSLIQVECATTESDPAPWGDLRKTSDAVEHEAEPGKLAGQSVRQMIPVDPQETASVEKHEKQGV